MPCTLNQYSYCWNRPLDYVDLDGKFPWLIIPVVIGAVMLTGCTAEEQDINDAQYIMPEPGKYEYKYTSDIYNSNELKLPTLKMGFAP